MKPEIPPSARDALARLAAADEHPSADLLNGFVEHALSAAEQKLVTAHLAACADCREVVFLASTAAEEDRQVAAVAAARPDPATAKATRRWISWKWAAPALAMVVIVAGIIVEHQSSPPEIHEVTSRALVLNRNRSAPAMQAGNPAPEQMTALNTPAQPAEKKAAPVRKPGSSDRETQRERAQAMQNEAAASMSESLAVHAPQQPVPPTAAAVGGVMGGVAGGAAPRSTPAQSAARVSNSLPKRSAAPGVMAKAGRPAALSGLVQNAPNGGNDLTYVPATQKALLPPNWRITDDGHLEHAASPSAWMPVLADQPVSFHAVAVIGNEVWAGGSAGALFHSADAGESWARAALTADDQQEAGTIISIRFDNAEQGSVTTDSGTTWTTADGGKSWSKH